MSDDSADIWKARKTALPNGSWAIYDRLNRVVGSTCGLSAEDQRRGAPGTKEGIEANAQMLAAAPRLATELRELCSYFDEVLAVASARGGHGRAGLMEEAGAKLDRSKQFISALLRTQDAVYRPFVAASPFPAMPDPTGRPAFILVGESVGREGVCLGRAPDGVRYNVSPDGSDQILTLRHGPDFGILVRKQGKEPMPPLPSPSSSQDTGKGARG